MAPKHKKKTKQSKEAVQELLNKKSYKSLSAWKLDDPKSYGWAKTDLDYWTTLIDKYFRREKK